MPSARAASYAARVLRQFFDHACVGRSLPARELRGDLGLPIHQR